MKANGNLNRHGSLRLALAAGFACALSIELAAGGEAKAARTPDAASTGERTAFVVASAGGMGLKSVDGITWTSEPVTLETSFRSQCRGKNVSVRVGLDGRLWTSSSGTNWILCDARVPFALHRVTSGRGRFVAVGNEGAVVTSEDGMLWTQRDSGTDERLRGVAFGKNVFVAVGYAGTILVSRDGTRWSPRNPGTDVRLQDVAFGNGLFVAVGRHGTILTSSDGSRWRQVPLSATNHLLRVSVGDESIPKAGNGPLSRHGNFGESAATELPRSTKPQEAIRP